MPLSKTIAALLALDAIKNVKVTDGLIWHELRVLSARRESLPKPSFGCLDAVFNYAIALDHTNKIESRLTSLVNTVVSIDEVVGNFRDTFLREAESIRELPKPQDHSANMMPLKCEFIGASLPTKLTTTIEIVFANGAAPTQQIVIAASLVNLAQALLLELRPAETLYADAVSKFNARVRAKKFAKGTSQSIVLETVVYSEQGKDTYTSAIHKKITAAIASLIAAPDKLDDTRKQILKGATAAEAAKPAPTRLVFDARSTAADDD